MSDFLSPEQKVKIDDKALTTIQLCLSDEVLREVLNEKIAAGLWLKWESLYMTKFLTNKLYLKQRFFILYMAGGIFIKSYLDEFNLCLIDVKLRRMMKDYYCYVLYRPLTRIFVRPSCLDEILYTLIMLNHLFFQKEN
uniref:Reverse transcriptase Ty1/copia-type domain-containing protein n=1 Tax=Ananas comosus var. bracteatus TaxID=296719 RepID=A0A6V7P9J2_ANACO|nr:unnamed protein product [Ananas comosus var. bracteatus]